MPRVNSVSPSFSHRGSVSSSSKCRVSSTRRAPQSRSSSRLSLRGSKSCSSQRYSSASLRHSRQGSRYASRRVGRPTNRYAPRCPSSRSRSTSYKRRSISCSSSPSVSRSPRPRVYREYSRNRGGPVRKDRNRRGYVRSYSGPRRYRTRRSRSHHARGSQYPRHRSISSSLSPPNRKNRRSPPDSRRRRNEISRKRNRNISRASPTHYDSQIHHRHFTDVTTNLQRRLRPLATTSYSGMDRNTVNRRYRGVQEPHKFSNTTSHLSRKLYSTQERFLERIPKVMDFRPPAPVNRMNRVPVSRPFPLRRRRTLPPVIDHATTCPFLLRGFYNLNEHHSLEDLKEFLSLQNSEKYKALQNCQNSKETNKQDNYGALSSTKLERLHGCELQLYTWKDTSLRKIVDLIKDVCQEARIRTSKISLRLLHLENDGSYQSYEMGVLHNTRPGPDDKRTLLRSKFEIGDVLSIAIIRLGNPRILNPSPLRNEDVHPELNDIHDSKDAFSDSGLIEDSKMQDCSKQSDSEGPTGCEEPLENIDAFSDSCVENANDEAKTINHTTVVVDEEADGQSIVNGSLQLSG